MSSRAPVVCKLTLGPSTENALVTGTLIVGCARSLRAIMVGFIRNWSFMVFNDIFEN